MLKNYLKEYTEKGYSLEQLQKHLIENCGQKPMDVIDAVEEFRVESNGKKVEENPIEEIKKLKKRVDEIKEKLNPLENCVPMQDGFETKVYNSIIDSAKKTQDEIHNLLQAFKNSINQVIIENDKLYMRRFTKIYNKLMLIG